MYKVFRPVSQSVRRVALLMTVLVVALGAASVVLAHEGHDGQTIVVTDDGVTLPESWTSGITTLTLQNDTEVDFSPTIARFINGATLDDFTAAMAAQDFPGMLATISALGTVTAPAGESVEVTYDLQAGDYLFANFAQAGPPQILSFTVDEHDGEAAEAPEADVDVTMVEFAFSLPAELPAGEAVWHFTNGGEQTHELVLFSVPEDATAESVSSAVMDAMMSAGPGAPPELPYDEAFSFVGQSPDEQAWVTLDLEPGTYAAVCFLPDTASEDMSPHMLHGMISIFTVSE